MSEQLTIGIIREGKVPPDKRVPLTPEQCKALVTKFPEIKIFVQPSVKRCYPDSEYEAAGIPVGEYMEECDVLMGIKEVPVQELIAGKTYFYFSHTIKKQPHNRMLLLKMLELGITMVDYEGLRDTAGNRIIAFGRYAGIVGCYNAFRAFGEKFGTFKLKPAHLCYDRKEMEEELKSIKLPPPYKIAVTGSGRVGNGCLEILNAMGLKQVSPSEFLEKKFAYPVYTVLHVSDYYITADGTAFDKKKFYTDPSSFRPAFKKWAMVADMYIPCHFWDRRAPQILEKSDYLDPKFKLKIIADISCDIGQPIASTLRSSTIADPFYGYDPRTGTEADFYSPDTIGVMAVDNLPCELPRDASRDFGNVLIEKIIPLLIGPDPDKIIERATICKGGKLTHHYDYLRNYVDGVKG
jgi:saccharopine dehydrogenase (NAD+, L-lysine forming)